MIIKNSYIAKMLLYYSTCDTIMLFGGIFTKEAKLTDKTENHERIHVKQFLECFVVGTFIAICLVFMGHLISIVLPFILYYVLYLLEWSVSLIHHLFSRRKKDIVMANKKAYYSSAMEMEAYENEDNLGYLTARKFYSFLAYYGKL